MSVQHQLGQSNQHPSLQCQESLTKKTWLMIERILLEKIANKQSRIRREEWNRIQTQEYMNLIHM